MTDPVARQLLTELFAGHGWPAEGEKLLHQSLGPRPPELLLEAPGWLGLDAGQLVLEAGCRDATHAIALARRRALAFASWQLQIVLGRLMPVLYALGKPATGGTSSVQR
jgi:hypothetical protein